VPLYTALLVYSFLFDTVVFFDSLVALQVLLYYSIQGSFSEPFKKNHTDQDEVPHP
jgi:hypothetical protein